MSGYRVSENHLMVKSFKALAAIGVGACPVTEPLACAARAEAIAQDHTVQHLSEQVDNAKLDECHWIYQPTLFDIVSDGHTIQVTYQSGSSLALNGQPYEHLQFP